MIEDGKLFIFTQLVSFWVRNQFTFQYFHPERPRDNCRRQLGWPSNASLLGAGEQINLLVLQLILTVRLGTKIRNILN